MHVSKARAYVSRHHSVLHSESSLTRKYWTQSKLLFSLFVCSKKKCLKMERHREYLKTVDCTNNENTFLIFKRSILFQVRYRERITILRGNHESRQITQVPVSQKSFFVTDASG